jgi:hypothetical protein
VRQKERRMIMKSSKTNDTKETEKGERMMMMMMMMMIFFLSNGHPWEIRWRRVKGTEEGGQEATIFQTQRVYPKVSGLSQERYAYNNKHSLRSTIKGYGSKTH